MKTFKGKVNHDERNILIGMIVHDSVLGRISARWNPNGLFSSRWSNLIATWCIDYYEKYGKAPKKNIQTIFSKWSREEQHDKATSELVEKFLYSLSNEYDQQRKQLNSEFIIDRAGEHFQEVQLRNLSDGISGELDSGKLGKAKLLVDQYSHLELGLDSSIDLLHDEQEIISAFDDEFSESIVSYPGDLKRFIGHDFARDCFVSFFGPEKSGKTFFLLDLAFRAALQKLKVAYFEVGDLSRAQVIRRFSTRAARIPYRSHNGKWPVTVKIPTKISGGKFASLEYQEKTYESPLSGEQAVEAFKKLAKIKFRDQKEYLRISVHSSDSIDAKGIRGIIQGWEREGWLPDVVIIDYADLLATPKLAKDERDAINANWKQLRRISQDFHCLLVTATQTNANSYERYLVDRRNFSGDKRKLAHVSGMIGINALTQEREQQSCRLNWIVRREGAYVTKRFVHVGQCLALAQPTVVSCW